jgi:hypothetical protein
MCRATILKTLALNGDQETIAEARKHFAKHQQGEFIIADLRSTVYAAVLVNADEDTVNKFIDMHDSCDLQEEKVRLAASLGLVSNKDLIQKVLNYTLQVNFINFI